MICASLIGGCGDAPLTREQQIGKWIEKLEQAVEARDSDKIAAAFAAHYEDSKGNDRRQIERLIQFYLIRYPSPELVINVLEIALFDERSAGVELVVALANNPLTDDGEFLHATIKRVELSLRHDESDWQITQAHWQPATLGELL